MQCDNIYRVQPPGLPAQPQYLGLLVDMALLLSLQFFQKALILHSLKPKGYKHRHSQYTTRLPKHQVNKNTLIRETVSKT